VDFVATAFLHQDLIIEEWQYRASANDSAWFNGLPPDFLTGSHLQNKEMWRLHMHWHMIKAILTSIVYKKFTEIYRGNTFESCWVICRGPVLCWILYPTIIKFYSWKCNKNLPEHFLGVCYLTTFHPEVFEGECFLTVWLFF